MFTTVTEIQKTHLGLTTGPLQCSNKSLNQNLKRCFLLPQGELKHAVLQQSELYFLPGIGVKIEVLVETHECQTGIENVRNTYKTFFPPLFNCAKLIYLNCL